MAPVGGKPGPTREEPRPRNPRGCQRGGTMTNTQGANATGIFEGATGGRRPGPTRAKAKESPRAPLLGAGRQDQHEEPRPICRGRHCAGSHDQAARSQGQGNLEGAGGGGNQDQRARDNSQGTLEGTSGRETMTNTRGAAGREMFANCFP